MPGKANTDVIEDLIELRATISELEHSARIARVVRAVCLTLWIGAPVSWAVFLMCLGLLHSVFDFSSVVAIPLVWGGLAVVALFFAINVEDDRFLSPREIEVDLERAHSRQALQFSGASVDLATRRYVFRGSVQREIVSVRRRGDRYRRVNSAFQSVIIVGSLATTTAASLNEGGGLLKWVVVGLSFAVGLAAGFTGYFKYRERAFYLRQTADDFEERLSAYELGLAPYASDSEAERMAILTARLEGIRIAQQQREQQLDQPKAGAAEHA